MKRSISFDGKGWLAVSDQHAQLIAHDPNAPPVMRLLAAATVRANIFGHCPFKPEQPGQILAGKNGKPMSRQGVNRIIRQAVKLGFLSPESTRMCLVLDRFSYCRGYSGHRICSEPKHEGVRYMEWHRNHGWRGIHERLVQEDESVIVVDNATGDFQYAA